MNQLATVGNDIDVHALADRVAAGQVKALSIKQPYPHHIFHDGKDVENRDWPTKWRGWFIVHAGISKSEIDKDDDYQLAMPRGGVVGMAGIVDCVREMDSRWFFGKFGFVLRDAFPLPLIPCRGQLSFFNLEPEVNRLVAEAIRQRGAMSASRSRGGE
ncbi:hypothetical protein [Agrobacterium pusense]|uniref:hypothetical protein n=1 Tax=Agrobacterium pusense TaxID=648995 RepID=UPI0005129A4A|nr:hypothetical protein [Agrobacterium pusense]ANV24777.1 hypothetical protein BA939_13050 [Rhizobium sp. S41]KGE82714.1 hypothetical protein LW14_09465 [Rhizobium sp. H41]QWW74465.1 hypothetical protein KP800_02920 [Agrobacterium pusense]